MQKINKEVADRIIQKAKIKRNKDFKTDVFFNQTHKSCLF
jgi:hypothetical protein